MFSNWAMFDQKFFFKFIKHLLQIDLLLFLKGEKSPAKENVHVQGKTTFTH